jgi:hypothetical protein
MSVSIHSLFTPDELALEIECLEVRDTLLGENFVKQLAERETSYRARCCFPAPTVSMDGFSLCGEDRDYCQGGS